MFRKLISKYGLATHLALLAAIPVATTPFLAAQAVASATLWLAFFSAIWLFAEPSVRAGERHSDARQRVVFGILRDPISWFFFIAVVISFLRWLNSGIKMAYDAETSSWSVASAAISFFPGSVESEGLMPLAVIVAAFVLVCGIRQGLGYNARIWFGFFAATVAGVGGMAATICATCEMPVFSKAAACGFLDAPFWGSLFAPWVFFALAAGVHAEARRWGGVRVLSCVAVSGCVAALVFFAPPLIAAVYFVVAILFAMFCLAWASRVSSSGAAARCFVFLVFGSVVVVFLILTLSSDEFRAAKLSALDPAVALTEAWRETSASLSRVAKAMWLKDPWCGVGIGAFPLQAPFLVQTGDWASLPPQPVRALNGYWMLLAERGVLGAAVLATGTLLLVGYYVRRLVGAWRFARSDEGGAFAFVCPPIVWIAPMLLVLTLAEAPYSSIFSFSAFLLPFTAALALAAAAFPKPKEVA